MELVDQVDVAPTWARKDLGQTGGGEISRRIRPMNSAETYVANAVSMWSSFAPIIETSDLVLETCELPIDKKLSMSWQRFANARSTK